jgi:hypothetical protein
LHLHLGTVSEVHWREWAKDAGIEYGRNSVFHTLKYSWPVSLKSRLSDQFYNRGSPFGDCDNAVLAREALAPLSPLVALAKASRMAPSV